MAFENLLSAAKDMLEKAKNLVEETTGVDIDKIEESLAHPSELLDKAKEKGGELFEKAKAQFTDNDGSEVNLPR